MKSINKFLNLTLLAFGILLFSTCKKEIKIEKNTIEFGSIFSSVNEHFINKILVNDKNSYIICGTVAPGNYGSYDGFVMKVNQNFETIWYKNLGGKRQDYIFDMAMDEQKNIMLIGNSYSFGASIDSNNNYFNALNYWVYINNDGEIIWEKTNQPNPSAPNIDNYSRKVIYLNNQTFCIASETKNFITNGYYYSNVYADCLDKSGNLKWSKRYFNNSATFDNTCPGAVLCEDGNILLQERINYFNLQDPKSGLKFIKISSEGNGYTPNKFIKKSQEITDLVSYDFSTDFRIDMELIKEDQVIIVDNLNGGLAITDNLGNISQRITFSHPINNGVINKSGNKFIFLGTYKSDKGTLPCWVILDSEGKKLKEVYTDFDNSLSDLLSFSYAFINDDNQLVVFGNLKNNKGSNMIMLRYDSNGNLIKN